MDAYGGGMHLQGTFYILRKRCKVTLTDLGISWEPEGTPDLCHHVSASELVGCWVCPKASLGCCVYSEDSSDNRENRNSSRPSSVGVGGCRHSTGGAAGVGEGLSLEYCQRGSGHALWKLRQVALLHAAQEVVLAWHHAIWALINGLSQRPRKLLVIINPFGGKKKAARIYRKKVEPIFRRAAIQTHVIQTTHRGHGREIVEESSATVGIDGVVVVGGDGLVNEVVTGLLSHASQLAGIDADNPNANLPSTAIRVGIIPGGSTDATCHGTHGTSDVVTAALHIVMGDSRNVDVAAVHSEGRLQRVATTMCSYGYFGDLLKTSDRWRKLGPSRYLLAGLVQIMKNKTYEGQVRVVTPEQSLAQPDDKNNCTEHCTVCDTAAKDNPKPGQCLQYTGRWSVVTGAVASCACRLTPKGVSPAAHLGDGCADLLMVEGGSRFRMISYLYKTSTGNAFGLNHVRVQRVKELQFIPKTTTSNSAWNCDGEQMEEPHLFLKNKCSCEKLFMSRI
ncbi:unnamed protein product, partial [Meganyctiphanes norvegica]